MMRQRKEVFMIVIYPFIQSSLLTLWVLPRVISFTSGPGCGGLISSGKVNLSLSGSATSSYNSSLGPEQAIINNSLAWCTTDDDFDRFLNIDLGEEYNISALGSQDWAGIKNPLQQFRFRYYSSGTPYFYKDGPSIKTFVRNPSDKEYVVVHDIQGVWTKKVGFKLYVPYGTVCARFELYTCWRVNGSFSSWSSWSNCSVLCGNGTQTRTRDCTNPSPVNGGATCIGNYNETRTCAGPPCKVDGGFTTWGSWSQCSVQCGNGTQSRHRNCSNPTPAHGGATCIGNYNETKVCSLSPCKVDGGFAQWGSWSECSVQCGNGTRVRHRYCSNPVPAHGGSACNGSHNDTIVCVLSPCEEDRNSNTKKLSIDGPVGILLVVVSFAVAIVMITSLLYKLNKMHGSGAACCPSES